MEWICVDVLVYLTLVFVNISDCKTDRELHKDLFDGYNTNIVPRNDSHAPVEVVVSFRLMSLEKLTGKNEILETKSWLHAQWTDTNLKWNPETYDNIKHIYVKQKEIWVPFLMIGNSQSDFQSMGFDEFRIVVSSDGSVGWRPGLSLRTLCEVDTKYFPFDVQICSLFIESWTYATDVILNVSDTTTDLNPYTQNGLWYIVGTDVNLTKALGTYYIITLRLKLQRRVEYYLLSLISPIVFVSVLNCFIFLIPVHSGEKTSFSITVFLSFLVMMTFVTEDLPKTSKRISILIVYKASMLGISFLSVICCVVSPLISNYKSEKAYMKDEHDGKRDTVEDNASIRSDDTKLLNGNRASAVSTFDLVLFGIVSVLTVVSTVVTICVLLMGQANALAQPFETISGY